MQTIASILTAVVALEHLYILWMEMFAWETVGKKTFRGAMAENMFALANDPVLAQQFGTAGRLHVEENYDLEKQAVKLFELLMKAAKNRI